MVKNLRKALQQRAEGEMDESGFTLIELLIVIVVLGILAAVVIFSLGGVTTSSAISACNSDAKTVQTAEQAYISSGNAAGVGAAGQTALVPSYLHTWPTNTYYTISLDATTAGQVDVSVPITHGGSGVATNYDTQTGTPPVSICASITK